MEHALNFRIIQNLKFHDPRILQAYKLFLKRQSSCRCTVPKILEQKHGQVTKPQGSLGRTLYSQRVKILQGFGASVGFSVTSSSSPCAQFTPAGLSMFVTGRGKKASQSRHLLLSQSGMEMKMHTFEHSNDCFSSSFDHFPSISLHAKYVQGIHPGQVTEGKSSKE